MKNYLLIDIATPYFCILHIKFNPGSLEIENHRIGRIDSSNDTWFDALFSEAFSEEFDGILLGKGPGSFTSLRIAHSYLRVFAMLRQIPVFSFDSLLFWQSGFAASSEAVLIHTSKTTIFEAKENSYVQIKSIDLENYGNQALYYPSIWKDKFKISSSLKLITIDQFNVNSLTHNIKKTIFSNSTTWQELLPNYGPISATIPLAGL